MSSSLYWRPALPKPKGFYVEEQIKWILQKKYDTSWIKMPLGPEDLDYLNGLKDAGVEGAEDLIEAIEKHETIYLEEER